MYECRIYDDSNSTAKIYIYLRQGGSGSQIEIIWCSFTMWKISYKFQPCHPLNWCLHNFSSSHFNWKIKLKHKLLFFFFLFAFAFPLYMWYVSVSHYGCASFWWFGKNDEFGFQFLTGVNRYFASPAINNVSVKPTMNLNLI